MKKETKGKCIIYEEPCSEYKIGGKSEAYAISGRSSAIEQPETDVVVDGPGDEVVDGGDGKVVDNVDGNEGKTLDGEIIM